MKTLKNVIPMCILALMALTFAAPAMGQDQGPRGDRPDRRNRMDWNNMTPEQQEQMRQRFEERREQMRQEQAQRMREDLKMSEEEYQVLEPMIQKVQQLSMESMAFGRGLFGGRGGPGAPGRGGNPFANEDDMTPQGKALTEASDALRETLDKEDASTDEIKDRLAALRQARVATQDALRQAREELRGFVTPTQEAMLVLQGLLD